MIYKKLIVIAVVSLLTFAAIAVVAGASGAIGTDKTTVNSTTGTRSAAETVPEKHQTLLRTIDGERMAGLSLSGVDAGTQILTTDALRITGATGTAGTKYIWVEELIVDGLITPKFEIKNSFIHELIVHDNVSDGKSFGYTQGNAPNVVLGSTRGMAKAETYKNETFDRIELSTSTGDAFVKRIEIKDVKVFKTGTLFQYLKVGKLVITNSTIGKGDGIDSPDFVIYTTVVVDPPVTSHDNPELETNVQ